MLTTITSQDVQATQSSGLDTRFIKHTIPHIDQAHAKNPLISHLIDPALSFSQKIHGPTRMMGDNSHLIQGSLKSGNGYRFDAEAAPAHLCGDYLLRAEMSVTLPASPRPSQTAYYDQLERLGWVVNRFAPVVDGYGRVAENERLVDGSIRDSILAAADDTDCQSIVLFGADGAFTRAVKYARRCGKDVFVCSWANTLHPELAAACTSHISLETLRPLILRAYH